MAAQLFTQAFRPWPDFVLPPLLLLFLFLYLLLFVLFFVFLATLVSHACSLSAIMTRGGELPGW